MVVHQAQEEAYAQDRLTVRAATQADVQTVAAIDQAHTGAGKIEHWRGKLAAARGPRGMGFIAEVDGTAAGYLMGETRAWEFGSPPTGWIYAVGVARRYEGHGVGAALVRAALDAFAREGVQAVRTMVRRDDVGLLRFFRGTGFVAGPFVEMEVDCGRVGRAH